MSPREQTRPWVPVPMAWEAARFGDDGTRLRIAYITGDGGHADRADVRWNDLHLTVTLSRMERASRHEHVALFHHCVELRLSRDASDRLLVDGTTGELASAKQSRYLTDEELRAAEHTWDSVFEPREFLEPREVGP
jgi:hypothetical protein